jgi:hypothetical protein
LKNFFHHGINRSYSKKFYISFIFIFIPKLLKISKYFLIDIFKVLKLIKNNINILIINGIFKNKLQKIS